MENNYSNREIDVHFSDVKETLARIEQQVMRTNGRVARLENWRSYVVGFCAALILILPTLYGLVGERIAKLESDHVKNKSLLETLKK